MKLKNISPMGAIRTIVQTDPLTVIEAEAGGVVEVTDEQAALILVPKPNPHWQRVKSTKPDNSKEQ